ncbi:MAG: hypothetical protein LBV43_07950 [Prevotella sp.]|jgi:hypothetical protein|nr:hypothetical protein [Prevotella sp.]
MRKNLFLIILMVFSELLIAQRKDLSGNYYNESEFCFQIEKDTFRFIVEDNSPRSRASDIWASGIIKRIDDSFIELNTINTPLEKVHKSMNIIQKKEGIGDSLKIKFVLPYTYTKLRMGIYTDEYNIYEFIYSEKNKEIIIPMAKSVAFTIMPEYLVSHTSEGSFYGIVAFDPLLEYEIDAGMDCIEFEIPAIDNSFFETYYIKGDYARIMNGNIIWKGEVYKKQK